MAISLARQIAARSTKPWRRAASAISPTSWRGLWHVPWRAMGPWDALWDAAFLLNGSPPGMFGRKRNGKQSEGVPNLIDMNLRLFSGSDYSFELRGSNRTCWDGCEFVIPGLILFGLSALAWLAGAGA